MICINCGCAVPEGASFCPGCGEKMPSIIPPAPEPEPVCEPLQPGRKGTHWIPLAIMAALCAIGLILFYAMPYETNTEPGKEINAGVSEREIPWFTNDDGTLYFHEALYTGPEELTVPQIVDGIPVEHIADYCFSGCDRITTVILPKGLVSIGGEAFSGCSAMRGIFIPEGVTQINDGAFLDCLCLEAICIPSTVEHIGEDVFDGCGCLVYILYSDINSRWNDLYSEVINEETQVYCTDGTFLHSQSQP